MNTCVAHDDYHYYYDYYRGGGAAAAAARAPRMPGRACLHCQRTHRRCSVAVTCANCRARGLVCHRPASAPSLSDESDAAAALVLLSSHSSDSNSNSCDSDGDAWSSVY